LPRETAYDWAIVSSHLFAHQVDLRKIVPSGRKLVYVHSPARYLWEPEIDPRASSLALKIFGASLRSFDRSSACSGAKRIAVNSKFVRARVAKSWGLDSEVIYPPVRLGRLGSLQESAVLDELNLPEEFLLAVSRLVPYKRTEIALEIAAKMETAIVIVGSGSEEKKLRTYALQIGAKAHFMGAVEDQVLTLLYRRAKALIFPAIEDFGIIPVEAMSFGLPVIGNKLGGVSETVSDGVSGFLIDFASTSEAVGKVRDAERLSREDCLEVAQKFSTERFSSAMTNWVENSS
jgi:glycosyltransferase involved in cell wall biosynthesis